MSSEFRELLKKIGSGTHTHKNLNRQEAGLALEMMLTGIATPAQIGGFLIAHRIKRPTGEELAGMLDTYSNLGVTLPTLENRQYPLTILGIPYDGRTRTAPISPITTLILSEVGVPVLMHGGRKMPTKYGLTLEEIWRSLDIDLTQLSLIKIERLLNNTNFGFLYLPQHFPLANKLVQYREEIGKRPPIATLELIWQPYEGKNHLIAGYVHPPTEKMIREALKLREVEKFTLIKGLEGSGDLKLGQTNIIAIDTQENEQGYKYLKVNPFDYNLKGNDTVLSNNQEYFAQLKKTIRGEKSSLTISSILNGGFYLWRCGVSDSMEKGLTMAEELITKGNLQTQLDKIKMVNNE
ncbi:anthranilate phosphoribosyltransferase family protein [Geminocystis sp. GBBB08]|uniref:anthranilate phosphoribosyltransferase family protein n=1 Tax=Geminocystis sp. GBBB08 TaxID=2604140 RepID=UPI0027E367A0|nr:anthranilate phosphoribosyltransferase family protein [Geminocystis sp. GBBB08]MBL1209961.1 anthranilate phosphoribosyltransferase family protein [Geminocystis sp. GBBB08]